MARAPQHPRSLRSDAAEVLAVCAGWNSRLAARRITQFIEARMAPAGLSVAQFGLMTHLAAAHDDSLSALAQRLGLDPSTLTRNLQALARDGLVEIATPEGDSRRRLAWLTETGALKLEAAIPVWREAHRALEALFDPELAARLAQATAALDPPPTH